MKNRNFTLAIIVCLLVCFALLRQVQAVSPAPDGCYPNFTTAEGCDALSLLTTGAGNTGLGWRSLFFDTSGNFNTAVGGGALALNNADSNTAVGAGALLLNTRGTENVAVGADALVYNGTGGSNSAIGAFALSNSNGNFNTAVGWGALSGSILGLTGNNNTALGFGAGGNIHAVDNVICIGANVLGVDASNTTWIGNVYQTTTISGTTLPVIVSDSGQLGTASSSGRFKKEIKPMGKTSETILALKPVTFQYKSDAKSTPQFGLIAEEVAEASPDLVVRDKDGKPYSVRYDAVNAMLLNEFLKDHRKVAEQEATITRLKAELQATATRQQQQIEALTAGLHKVSARVEASRCAQQTLVSNP